MRNVLIAVSILICSLSSVAYGNEPTAEELVDIISTQLLQRLAYTVTVCDHDYMNIHGYHECEEASSSYLSYSRNLIETLRLVESDCAEAGHQDCVDVVHEFLENFEPNLEIHEGRYDVLGDR